MSDSTTPTSVTHTPTPWAACGCGLCHQVWSKAADCMVAVGLTKFDEPYTLGDGVDRETAQANAEFIVRAVNAHDALVDAAGRLYQRFLNGDLYENHDEAYVLLKDLGHALALARGEAS